MDRNFIQIDGSTEIVMPLGDVATKFESFNWNVIQINGNDFREINNAIYKAKNESDKPSVIIAKTIPSKGIKEWEGNYKWHGKAPNQKEEKMAMKELEEISFNI